MFAEYLQKERWIFAAYLIYIFKCMFVAYSQNVCRILAAYLICCLESCLPHIRSLLTQSIRRRPNLHVKSEHHRIIAEYSLAVRKNCSLQCIFSVRDLYSLDNFFPLRSVRVPGPVIPLYRQGISNISFYILQKSHQTLATQLWMNTTQ